MSKAVLVLNEMPTGCEKCPCNIRMAHGNGLACSVIMEVNDHPKTRPDFCPLREVKDNGGLTIYGREGII